MNTFIEKKTLFYARVGSPPFNVKLREEPNGEFLIELPDGPTVQVARATLRNFQALLAEVVIV